MGGGGGGGGGIAKRTCAYQGVRGVIFFYKKLRTYEMDDPMNN